MEHSHVQSCKVNLSDDESSCLIFNFFYLIHLCTIFQVDPEAERQGEILAFYGEEETRNYDSPEPGPAVEKDDTPVTHQQAEPANGQV